MENIIKKKNKNIWTKLTYEERKKTGAQMRETEKKSKSNIF